MLPVAQKIMASNGRMTANDELKNIWKEVVVTQFEAPSWNQSGVAEVNHKNSRS
jgi:hypothetical protein